MRPEFQGSADEGRAKSLRPSVAFQIPEQHRILESTGMQTWIAASHQMKN